MSEGRKLLGEKLNFEERISLAQLTTQPGWNILVKLMAEACRLATEQTIKLSPTVDRYPEQLVGLQTTARAMNLFSSQILDSVRVHQRNTVTEVQQRDNPTPVPETAKRFRLPIATPEGAQ